jgi:hypothetical protein
MEDERCAKVNDDNVFTYKIPAEDQVCYEECKDNVENCAGHKSNGACTPSSFNNPTRLDSWRTKCTKTCG